MSHVLTIAEMIALEKTAFADGVDPWELMQDAAQQMVRAISRRCPTPGRCQVYVGKGNNAGDALVVASGLREMGWAVDVVLTFPKTDLSPLARKAMEQWERNQLPSASSEEAARLRGQPMIVLDGLLGSGVRGEIRPPILEMIHAINQSRREGARVFALDLPSGLGSGRATTVMADETLVVGYTKQELLEDEATVFVGRLTILRLELLAGYEAKGDLETDGSLSVATASTLRRCLPPRPFEQHKGQSGRVAIVAGSAGTAGAAVLAAHGALRAGAGLVSLFYPSEIHPQIVAMLPPEVMARPWESLADLASGNFDVFAIGPGLQADHFPIVLSLIRAVRERGIPMVLDAGALSPLAHETTLLHKLVSSVLLTPHPGEMERLFPQNARSRRVWAADFVADCGATLLLKGARTLVAAAGQPQSYNPTGHPGMATGGMGDTLTGVCAALIAQKLTAYDAARLGAWVCGRAAEIALQDDGHSQESLLPSDLARALGRAFSDLRLAFP